MNPMHSFVASLIAYRYDPYNMNHVVCITSPNFIIKLIYLGIYLKVDAKMALNPSTNVITYYDYANAHQSGLVPPQKDSQTQVTKSLSKSAAEMKLKNEQGKKTKFGEPVEVGEQFWAFRGTEYNYEQRKLRAEQGEGTGSTFFYSMLGDLVQFVEEYF